MISVMPSKSPILYPAQSLLLRDLGQRLREARLRRRFSVSLVAQRAQVSRPTMNKVEQGDSAVTMGTYLRVLAVLGLDKDLQAVAADDALGRRLQDAELGTPKRAPKARRSMVVPDAVVTEGPGVA
jgi:transcriptional regulator with XRE-family HTH domain